MQAAGLCPRRGFADVGLATDSQRVARWFAVPCCGVGCPVPLCMAGARGRGDFLMPSPSQGANVMLGVQQMGPDGSAAPCPGKARGSALGGGLLEGK